MTVDDRARVDYLFFRWESSDMPIVERQHTTTSALLLHCASTHHTAQLRYVAYTNIPPVLARRFGKTIDYLKCKDNEDPVQYVFESLTYLAIHKVFG